MLPSRGRPAGAAGRAPWAVDFDLQSTQATKKDSKRDHKGIMHSHLNGKSHSHPEYLEQFVI